MSIGRAKAVENPEHDRQAVPLKVGRTKMLERGHAAFFARSCKKQRHRGHADFLACVWNDHASMAGSQIGISDDQPVSAVAIFKNEVPAIRARDVHKHIEILQGNFGGDPRKADRGWFKNDGRRRIDGAPNSRFDGGAHVGSAWETPDPIDGPSPCRFSRGGRGVPFRLFLHTGLDSHDFCAGTPARNRQDQNPWTDYRKP